MHLFKVLLLTTFLVSLQSEAAEIGGINVTGEVAFDYNFLSSKDTPIPFTEGASNETYRLQSALVRVKKEDEQILFLSRLNYAPKQYSPDGTNTTTVSFGFLSQLEVFYKLTPELHIGFGRLITTMGYDSVMRSKNSFYNNTVAYQKIEPGSGEGLRANYILSDRFTVSASTYNQFNYGATGEDYTPSKATELSVAIRHSDMTWFAGYLTGKDAATTPATGTTDKSASNFWLSYVPGNGMLWVLSSGSLILRPEGSYTQWVDATSAMAVYTYGIHNPGVRYEIIRGAKEIGASADGLLKVLYVTDKIKLTDHLNIYIEGRFDRESMITFAALAYF